MKRTGAPDALHVLHLGAPAPVPVSSAPCIETERLILRAFRREDLDAHAATLADRDVVRHLGGHSFNREDSWRRLTMAVGQWPLLGYGYWAVEQKADHRLVGQVGFADFERGMVPDISGAPEMGWVFDTSVHGQGIAGEACRAALAWIDGALAPTDIPAIISIENAKSMRLAERLGFVREPDAVYRDELIALFWRRR
ncbi:MAG: GNAT family N-acetyltransferase [Sphingomicrobium sp.]|nr:GNAT family N-acetyltransferase [Sphingomonadales bacterium]